jgi:hypothetical protein
MKARALSESDWQAQVVHLARLKGWRVAHFRTSRTSSGGWATAVAADGKGFPDLVLSRRGRVLFRELKTDRGALTPEQKQWGETLGDLFAVWRPRDIDQVKAELS